MDPSADVLNISSDEEDGNSRGVSVEDDYSWLTQFLDADEDDDVNNNNDKSNDDDEDDVVVVEEEDLLNSNPKQKLKPCVNDLDDDCMILDGDPDKAVEVQNDDVDESDDEVLVVSEKGQVACRDYPHARHLCAAHPFSSSPHESHCDQCHCYVCDCRVPCLLWGTGDSYVDHCHATDKDDFWVLQRKSTRNGEMPSPKPILKPHIDKSLPPIQPIFNNQIPSSVLVEPSYVNPVAYAPISIRPNPNIINPSIVNPNYANNHQLNSYVVPRNRLPTNLALQNRSNGYNCYNNNNSPRSGRNLSPHSVSQRPVFKRSASFGSSTAPNRHVYSSSNNAYVPYVPQSQSLPVLPLAEQNPFWTNSSINIAVTNQPRVLPCQSKYLLPRQQPQVNPGPTYGAFGRFETPVPSHSQMYSPPPVFGQESQNCGGLPSLPETDIGWVNPCSQANAGNDMVHGGALQADTHTSHLAEFNEPLYPDLLDPSLLDFESWGLDSHPPVSVSNNTFVQSPEPGSLNSDILFNL
jgi:hypothetical protein